MPIDEQLYRLAMALFAGAAIGLEREIRYKDAGLRTHALVALGAATFMVLAASVSSQVLNDPMQRFDPLRVLGALIGGIGFLAAGAILQKRGSIRGLTTAASLWMTTALGAAAGLGQYTLAFSGVVITVLVLWPISIVERTLRRAEKATKLPLEETLQELMPGDPPDER
jgi:putative Mg2+ transporter-C (MgtC) family protein